MKNSYILLIIAALATGLTACKKDSKKNPAAGKWQETKLRLYATDGTGAFLYDTTYLQPFTGADFIQFNTNGTCIIGSDHYYYPNQPGEPKNPQQIPANTSTLNYTIIGSAYILSSQSKLVNPGGFDVRDTVMTVNSNTLLYHSILYSHQPGVKVVTDAYYTK